MIGQGGFGRVALCKNKLDGRQYAVKKIRLKDRSPQVNEKILRFLYLESYLLVQMCCRIMLLFFPFHVLIWNLSLWSKQKPFHCLLLGTSLFT
jgi:translation initiation factor 2-alpha kinase 4